MKKQTIPAILLFILALVIVIGSQTFLSPCVHEDGAHGVCYRQRASESESFLPLGIP